MAITKCRLQNVKGGTTQSGDNAVQVYYVDLDSQETDPLQVISQAQNVSSPEEPVPKPNDLLNSTHAALKVTTIQAEQRTSGPEGRLCWKVVVLFSNPSKTQVEQPPDFDKPPTERKARFQCKSLVDNVPRDFGENQEAISFAWVNPNDVQGEPTPRAVGTKGPITNSAGFRFGEVPTKIRRRPLFSYTYNTLDPFAWLAFYNRFRDTFNSDEWKVFGTARTAKAKTCAFYDVIQSGPMYFGETIYYEVEVQVLYDDDGHDIRVRDEGSQYWRLRTAQNADGQGITQRYVLETPTAGGYPVPPPIQLERPRGTLRANQQGAADHLHFVDLKPRVYSDMIGRTR